jgi:hypothetical protein
MIERRAIASKADKADNPRPADAAPKPGNGAPPPPTLEQEIAAALRADTSPSVADLDALLGEVELAATAAATTAVEERERALDITTDPATAHERVLVAELSRDRLHTVLPSLRSRLAEVESQEYAQRWESDYRRAEALRDAAAQRFARYPALVHELIEIILEAQAVDAEVSCVNGSALPGEHRRLQSVELKARGLENFSISNPSVVDMVRLPDWEHSERMLWPPHRPIDPAMVVPMQVGDPRLTTDQWWEVGEEQRAAEAERQRAETIEAEQARIEFYRPR